MTALLAGLLVAASLSYAAYTRDMRQIRQTLTAASSLVQTRHGAVEYTSWGDGAPVLVLHGAGGGYDQGRLIPQTFADDGYRWISVSRFGYLRSDFPADASTHAQAEAFADLLDALGVDRSAIMAMSGGAPPALQFAAHYPERTTALILLSPAPFTPFTAGDQDLPIPAWLYQALFRSDFVFWAARGLSPHSFDSVFDITPAARAQMSETDRAFADGLLTAFLPVTDRATGLRNEGAAIDPDAHYDLASITAPTLVVHARNDGINPFAIGEYLSSHIAGAAFLPLPSGGHLLLGHGAALRDRIAPFLALSHE